MEIDIKISSEQTIEHNGKKYRPVAIRRAKKGEACMGIYGEIEMAKFNHQKVISVILQEVIHHYRTPTDEDAKQRPMAEFWDTAETPPNPSPGTLVAVIGGEWPFVTAGRHRVTAYRYCRIPNEQRA